MQSVTFRHRDGTIDSSQRARVVTRLSPAELERLYLREIRRVTWGSARFSRGAIRVFGVWPVLLRFGPLVDGRRAIAGGLIARRPGGTIGWFTDTEHTSVNVEGFEPLLRGALWQIEARFHTVVGRRFFARLAREGS
jgi:hypothetical protein